MTAADSIRAAHASRAANSPLWTVAGPGVGPQLSRAFVHEDLARALADRLNAAHGAGTHTVSGVEP